MALRSEVVKAEEEAAAAYGTGPGAVRLSRATKKSKKASRGKQLIEHLKRHGGDIKLTTDEIMALTRSDQS